MIPHKAGIRILAQGLRVRTEDAGRQLDHQEILEVMKEWKREVIGLPWGDNDQRFFQRIIGQME